MEMLEKLPPEVLIYIQKIRKFIDRSEESRKYFEIDENPDEFFEKVTSFAKINFEETGDPELTIAQFEKLKPKNLEPDMYGVFMYLGNYGLISLN